MKNKLITLPNGKKLWALLKGAYPKNLQWRVDQDYIDDLATKLSSKNKNEASKAAEALEFLNDYLLAELKGNFKALEKNLGQQLSKEFRAETNSERNSAQRDVLNYFEKEYPICFEEVFTTESKSFSDLAEERKDLKKKLRKSGLSINSKEEEDTAPQNDFPEIPGRELSKEEVELLSEVYLRNFTNKP